MHGARRSRECVALDRRDTALERLAEAEEQWPDSEFLEDVRERLFSESP